MRQTRPTVTVRVATRDTTSSIIVPAWPVAHLPPPTGHSPTRLTVYRACHLVWLASAPLSALAALPISLSYMRISRVENLHVTISSTCLMTQATIYRGASVAGVPFVRYAPMGVATDAPIADWHFYRMEDVLILVTSQHRTSTTLLINVYFAIWLA